MLKIFISLFLTLALPSSFCYAQLVFFETPQESQTRDSIFFETSSKCFYSYFEQRFDSILLNFNLRMAENIYQRAALEKTTKNGYLNYYLDSRLIYSFEVINGKVNGLGVSYNSLLKETNGFPTRQGTFKNNRLNGFDIWIDSRNGVVYKVLRYKKGKLKEIIFWD